MSDDEQISLIAVVRDSTLQQLRKAGKLTEEEVRVMEKALDDGVMRMIISALPDRKKVQRIIQTAVPLSLRRRVSMEKAPVGRRPEP